MGQDDCTALTKTFARQRENPARLHRWGAGPRLKGHFDRGNVARQDSSSNRYDPKYAASDFGTLLSVRSILLLKTF